MFLQRKKAKYGISRQMCAMQGHGPERMQSCANPTVVATWLHKRQLDEEQLHEERLHEGMMVSRRFYRPFG